MWRFGIEHELAFAYHDGVLADFITAPFALFDQVIAQLPLYLHDYPQLYVGDAGIRHKRWYVEGVERFDEDGQMIACVPKGIEIRTTPHSTIQGAVDELRQSADLLRVTAAAYGLTPVVLSFNPTRTAFVYDPPLNVYEQQLYMDEPDYQTEGLAMLTYGPDLNLSRADWCTAQVIDAGRKLTFYSPFIVPFSFSSPFYAGARWEGLSVRTFLRTGARPAARVFVAHTDDVLVSQPALTKVARTPSEAGRIEFKACDSSADFDLYAGLLALLKGLLLDTTLPGRATTPDAALHQRAALQGFAEAEIYAGSAELLQAVAHALRDDPDAVLLAPLAALLNRRETPAHALMRGQQPIPEAALLMRHRLGTNGTGRNEG